MSGLSQSERDLVKCEDMRLYAGKALRFTGQLTLDEFCRDELVQAAVTRCIEVIGEAAKAVSQSSRDHAPGIPWPLITNMRNVLAHNYGAVDPVKIYETVREHIPPLLANLQTLIASLEHDVKWRDDS